MGCYENATKEKAAEVNVAQPGLVMLFAYLAKRWPGGMSLGIHFDRPIRGGTAPSLHAEGRALDWRYADLPDGSPGIIGGRATVDSQVLPFLIDHCDLLGIQGIGDYNGPDGNGRFWKRCRSADGSGKGWKPQADSSSGWGQPWADWLHIEMDWEAARDSRTIEERLSLPLPPVEENMPGIVGFPTLKLGAKGGAVKALQGMLAGRLNEHFLVDGDFGPATDAGVRDYQTRTGLTVDGIVGPKTWTRLGS